MLGIDDLDAYEYICDGNADQGADALYIEPSESRDENERLLLFQSKYPERPKNVGVTDIRNLIGVAEPFQSAEALEELLRTGVEPELRRLIQRFDVIDKLRRKRIDLRLVFVTAGRLTPEARHLIRTTNANRGAGFLKAYDALDLAPTVEAFRSPRTLAGTVTVRCDRKSRFVSTIPGGRVLVGRVAVADIVKWPGIEDRTLFDLNVRRELKRNPVRRALDRAVGRAADHPNFIAYHNGLTVVCHKVDDTRPKDLIVTDLSVVNGLRALSLGVHATDFCRTYCDGGPGR